MIEASRVLQADLQINLCKLENYSELRMTAESIKCSVGIS